jgi:hypothetical protein
MLPPIQHQPNCQVKLCILISYFLHYLTNYWNQLKHYKCTRPVHQSSSNKLQGHFMAQMVSHQPSSQRQGFDPRQVHVGYYVDKLALKQVFLQALWFPQSVSFHQYSILIHSSTTDTIAYNLSLLGCHKITCLVNLHTFCILA